MAENTAYRSSWVLVGVGVLLIGLFVLGKIPSFINGMFMTKTYETVEVILEVDGERVTVTGTALCTTVRDRRLLRRPMPDRVTRVGGAATSVLSDGRVVVIPYSDQEYCASPLIVGESYQDRLTVFNRPLSLRGDVDILLLDDEADTVSAELILGPEYYRNPNASIKLIGAYRWRSKHGEITTSNPDLFSSEMLSGVSGGWVGTYLAVLPAKHYEADLSFSEFKEYVEEHLGGRMAPLVSQGMWATKIIDSQHTHTLPVLLRGRDVHLATISYEPFRIPMERWLVETGRWYPDRQTVTGAGACYGEVEDIGWWLTKDQRFFRNENEISGVFPVGANLNDRSTLFLDRGTSSLMVGVSVCVGPR